MANKNKTTAQRFDLLKNVPTLLCNFGAVIVMIAGFSSPLMAKNPPKNTGLDIIWRLENPFRLFTDQAHWKMHRKAFNGLSVSERETPILSIERKLAAQFKNGWSANVFNATCWDPIKNTYKGCRGKKSDYINPRSHRVVARLRTPNFTGTCRWTMWPAELRKSKKSLHKIKNKTRPCRAPVAFDIPYPKGGTLEVRLPTGKVVRKALKIQDVFIVGIGDSFASGEGNPDVPVIFSDKRRADYGLDPKKRALKNYPARAGRWKKLNDSTFRGLAAQWQSRPCHRSLYSYQLRAALHLAIEDPQRAVTFAGFACAGSEIVKGIFVRYKGTEYDKNPTRLSQISAVSNALCGARKPVMREYPTAYGQMGRFPELNEINLLKCYKPVRKIDLLFLSIGGNDVGFSPLLANAVISKKSLLRKAGVFAGSIHDVSESRWRISRVKHAYEALRKSVHYLLGVSWKQADRVLITAYPSLSYRADGKTPCDGAAGMGVYPDFHAGASRLAEGEKFGTKLYSLMRGLAKKYHWSLVSSHRKAFRSHGYCAQNSQRIDSVAELLDFPRFSAGGWTPFAPSAFRPYASRQRWFRTPVDAYMTANFHAKGPISRKILGLKRTKWAQVVLASTYSGSFHPTAEGHAVIADAVVVKARKILAKYR